MPAGTASLVLENGSCAVSSRQGVRRMILNVEYYECSLFCLLPVLFPGTGRIDCIFQQSAGICGSVCFSSGKRHYHEEPGKSEADNLIKKSARLGCSLQPGFLIPSSKAQTFLRRNLCSCDIQGRSDRILGRSTGWAPYSGFQHERLKDFRVSLFLPVRCSVQIPYSPSGAG